MSITAALQPPVTDILPVPLFSSLFAPVQNPPPSPCSSTTPPTLCILTDVLLTFALYLNSLTAASKQPDTHSCNVCMFETILRGTERKVSVKTTTTIVSLPGQGAAFSMLLNLCAADEKPLNDVWQLTIAPQLAVPSTKEPKSHKKRDNGGLKMITSYNLFCEAQRPVVREANPNIVPR